MAALTVSLFLIFMESFQLYAEDSGLPDFCLKPLNIDDCGLPQKQVYFYDKNVSSCRPGVWRGCATDNMFDTQTGCAQFCMDTKESEGLPDFCLKPLNMEDCGLPQKQVYFYDMKVSSCKAGVWRGCATDNMFDTQPGCAQFCMDTKKSEEAEVSREILSTQKAVDTVASLNNTKS